MYVVSRDVFWVAYYVLFVQLVSPSQHASYSLLEHSQTFHVKH